MFAEVSLPLPLDKNFSYAVPENLAGKLSAGMRVLVPFGPRKAVGVVVNISDKSEFAAPKEIYGAVEPYPVITENLFKLAGWISTTCFCSLGDTLNSIFPLSLKSAPLPEPASVELPPPPGSAGIHTKLSAAMKNGSHAVFAVNTISRTERPAFYADAISLALQHGGGCILLVPEISLIEQFLPALRERFGNTAGQWHAGLPDRQKIDTWLNALQGNLKIIVGARSAVFAPVKNLKLVIVDEEADQSHKNQQKPFYDARDTAIEYARISNAPVILAGGLLSISSYHKTTTGKITSLSHKTTGAPVAARPEIRVIKIPKGSWISADMSTCLQETRMKNGLSIVFMNRRGQAAIVYCKDCKAALKCPKCSIPLSLHAQNKPFMLKCNYCGFKQEYKGRCLKCRGSALRELGAGSEKIESELKNLLPQARIERADNDSLRAPGSMQKLLDAVKSGAVDVIVATQVIMPVLDQIKSAGHSARKLSFIGMHNIDPLLYTQDHTASEKTFQLVYALTGALDKTGVLMLQATDKTVPFFSWVKKLNWKAFYRSELELRRELDYPPFKELLNVIIRGKDKQRVEEEAEMFYNFMVQHNPGDLISILGPEEPSRAMLRGDYRRQVMLKFDAILLAELSRDLKTYKPKAGIHIAYDLNPASMM